MTNTISEHFKELAKYHELETIQIEGPEIYEDGTQENLVEWMASFLKGLENQKFAPPLQFQSLLKLDFQMASSDEEVDQIRDRIIQAIADSFIDFLLFFRERGNAQVQNG